MFSPRRVYRFLKSEDFHSILNQSFYKRHMESIDIVSPFDTAEEIFLLEYLINQGYVIASYRNDDHNDTETYLLSTMGHAFLEQYGRSFMFRMRAHIAYFMVIYGLVLASTIGSLIATILYEKVVKVFF